MSKHTYVQTDICPNRHMSKPTYVQTDICQNRHMYKQTYVKTDILNSQHNYFTDTKSALAARKQSKSVVKAFIKIWYFEAAELGTISDGFCCFQHQPAYVQTDICQNRHMSKQTYVKTNIQNLEYIYVLSNCNKFHKAYITKLIYDFAFLYKSLHKTLK